MAPNHSALGDDMAEEQRPTTDAERSPGWDGQERRRRPERRRRNRRLDERRTAGIGEVQADRRQRGRRSTDRQGEVRRDDGSGG